MKTKSNYEQMIETMPQGLDRSILRVLSQHIGKQSAISRTNLVATLRIFGMSATDRQVREVIKSMRRSGHIICSFASEGGGYYLASTLAEYRDFKQKELLAKILDMEETLRAMDKAAQQQFGEGYQPTLV